MKYKTRDPKPTTREPVLENEGKPAVVIEVEQPKCKRCGGGHFYRNSATRPSLAADKMTRRKQCCACGQWHVMQSAPTTEERARYWKKSGRTMY